MKPATLQNLQTTLRWFLGLLLLWAAVSKLANPSDFFGSIKDYQLPLSDSFLKFVVVVLPWFELLCGLLLIANLWSETALAAATGLLIIFVMATGQAWARRLDIACGCFDLKILGIHGPSDLTRFLESATFAFFRNLALASLAGLLFWKRMETLKAELAPQKSGRKQTG